MSLLGDEIKSIFQHFSVDGDVPPGDNSYPTASCYDPDSLYDRKNADGSARLEGLKALYMKAEQLETIAEQTDDLYIKAYTSVLVAGIEQAFYIVLASKRAPPIPIYVSFGSGNKVFERAYVSGNVLKALVIPDQPGDIAVSFADEHRNPVDFELMLPQLAGQPPLQRMKSVTVHVLELPRLGHEPKLCYTSLRTAVSEDISLNEDEVDFLISNYESKKTRHGANRPVMVNPRNKSKNSLSERANNLLIRAYGTPKNGNNIFNAVRAGLAVGQPGLSIVPSSILMALPEHTSYHNRLIIQTFHTQLLEYDPFNLTSANIFMKSKGTECYSVFGFSLTPLLEERNEKKKLDTNVSGSPDDILRGSADGADHLTYVASLDRFECQERSCADIRRWVFVDACAPSKNEQASRFTLPQEYALSEIRCPVPACLTHNASVGREDVQVIEGLEVAPQVHIFFEKWPLLDKVSEENLLDMGVLEEHKREDFAVFVLGIKNQVYYSVTPVHKKLITFIISRWLPYVPSRYSTKK